MIARESRNRDLHHKINYTYLFPKISTINTIKSMETFDFAVEASNYSKRENPSLSNLSSSTLYVSYLSRSYTPTREKEIWRASWRLQLSPFLRWTTRNTPLENQCWCPPLSFVFYLNITDLTCFSLPVWCRRRRDGNPRGFTGDRLSTLDLQPSQPSPRSLPLWFLNHRWTISSGCFRVSPSSIRRRPRPIPFVFGGRWQEESSQGKPSELPPQITTTTTAVANDEE